MGNDLLEPVVNIDGELGEGEFSSIGRGLFMDCENLQNLWTKLKQKLDIGALDLNTFY